MAVTGSAKSDVGFGCSAVGAGMLAAGASGYVATWVFVVAGAALALGGLMTLGLRGSVLLALCGAWLALSVRVDGAAEPWNLLVSGIAAVALGFTVGVTGLLGSVRAAEEPG